MHHGLTFSDCIVRDEQGPEPTWPKNAQDFQPLKFFHFSNQCTKNTSEPPFAKKKKSARNKAELTIHTMSML
jgi:hypothetical protein